MKIFASIALMLIASSALGFLTGDANSAVTLLQLGVASLGVALTFAGGYYVGIPLMWLVFHWAMPTKFPWPGL